MSAAKEAIFKVNPYTEPVIVKVYGKARYTNCSPLQDFFNQQIKQGRRNFVIDFSECHSMDSTFLGIITGAALKLRKFDPPGKFALCCLGKRNRDLVKNLGLNQLMEIDVDSTGYCMPDHSTRDITNRDGHTSRQEAKMILKAHEDLCKLDQANIHRFQDVIAYLKNEVEKDSFKD